MLTIHDNFLMLSCDRPSPGTALNIPWAAQGWGVWSLVEGS